VNERRFVVGPAYCLLTLELVAECEHCRALNAEPSSTHLVVTKVDRERGVMTVETRGDDSE
jgi:hypothetical protein